MTVTEALKREIRDRVAGEKHHYAFRAEGYRLGEGMGASPSMKRALAIRSLFLGREPYIYKNDLVIGSFRQYVKELTAEELRTEKEIAVKYPERSFSTNADHFAPYMKDALTVGLSGMAKRLATSKEVHRDEPERVDMLLSMEVALSAFREHILAYAKKARALIGSEGYNTAVLLRIAESCERLSSSRPESFYDALTLTSLLNIAFNIEGRCAMAFGRMDQFLYPFYERDKAAGRLTDNEAILLLENVFIKTHENRVYNGGEQVLNICVGGVNRDGSTAVNPLSYLIVRAVKNAGIPGPNLSARISSTTPDAFLDECLVAIGTGLGYPALMNDEVNIAALKSFGYDVDDVYDYCFVGCIENFISGRQAPWSDSRFDTPKLLEIMMGGGKEYYSSHGKEQNFDVMSSALSVDLSAIKDMNAFMAAFEKQLRSGAEVYMREMWQRNGIPDPENYTSPFLSLFCYDCIGRGLDINMGGAKYPAAHAPGLMGVGTVVDSLAAIEKVVFNDGECSLTELAEALKANFVGYEALRERLLAAPKYGNNDGFVDKYAVWFVKFLSEVFREYKTPYGGNVFVGMASNVSNVYSGAITGATPDGRLAGVNLSDAASPTYGKDKKGITSTLLSCSKADYTAVGCGTVLNQKLSPSMFSDEKRPRLLSLIRVYFARGGQEIQINSTSPELLRDAMAHPENYGDLVVRVSGFSSYYVTLDRRVQEDILMRTQHE